MEKLTIAKPIAPLDARDLEGHSLVRYKVLGLAVCLAAITYLISVSFGMVDEAPWVTTLVLKTLSFGTLAGLLPIWGVFAAGQLLEGMAVTPWLVGERVGLHPVAVIFALMAFGQLFGFVGILVAIPAAAASLVALRHLKAQLD